MTWHNQIVILKQQLQQLAAVIGSGLIQAIKPFVIQMNAALSGLIKFAQNVVNALGKIFGWEMEVNTKGLTIDDDALEDIDTSGLDDIGDSADNASDSVKKLKNQLQGFDKLNVLSTKKNSGKGDDGSGSGLGMSGGDVTAALKKTKSAFESEIDNWFDLGRHISDTLSKVMEDIPWDTIFQKARNFGKDLADFLNGLITPRLFANVGRTIANSINASFEFLNSFGHRFKWDNFGQSIGFGINAYLRQFNWALIKDTAKTWGRGLATTINEAVSTTSFKKIGETIANAIGTAIVFAFELGNTLKFEEIGSKLAGGINGFIRKFPAKKFADTIDAWVQGIYDLVTTALKELDWNALKDKIKEFFGNLDWKTIRILLGGLMLIKGAGFAINFGGALMSEISKRFVAKIAKVLLADLAGSAVLKKAIGTGISEAAGGATLGTVSGGSIIASLAGVVGAIGGVVLAAKGMFDIWTKGWSAARGLMVGAGTAIALAIGVVAGVLTGPLALAIAGVVAGFTLLGANWKTIKEGIANKVNELKTSFDSLKDDAGKMVGGMSDNWKRLKAGVSDMVGKLNINWKTMKTDAGGAFKILESHASGKIKTLKTNVSKYVSELKKDAEDKWETLKTNVGNKVESLRTGVEGKWETLKTNVGKKMDTLKTNVSGAWDKVKTLTNTKISGNDSILSKANSGFQSIVTGVGGKLKTLKDNVSDAWENVRDKAWKKITSGDDSVLSKVKAAFKKVVNAVKNLFPIKISNWLKFPRIRLTTSQATLLGKTFSYPTGFEFYKKAYKVPYMFTNPTVIPSMGKYNVFGDGNGGEMVYGHSNLMDDIKEASGRGDITAIGNRQLANDQRIIQLLTIIAKKEFGITAREMFDVIRNEASNYSYRTGKGAFDY